MELNEGGEGKTLPSNNNNKQNGELSLEEELRQLKEKTNAWKQSVAVQLNEAAKKNKQLRDELKGVNASHEVEMAALRVQLDKEFRERTSLKDEEIQELQRQIMQIREEKRHMAEEHEKELIETTSRVRENCKMENISNREAELAQREAETRQLRDTVETKDKLLLQAEHDVALLTARLERLGEQYKELSTLMTNDVGQFNDNNQGNTSGETSLSYQNALKLSDAAHQQQLETARSELRNLEEKNASKLREAQRSYEVERQRWMDDLYQREEQLAALQALLRQAQHEAASSQQQIASARAEKERAEQRLSEKVAALSKELANRMEQGQQLSLEVGRLQREVSHQESLVRSLEEEASMREEAFASLMLSEDSRALVQGLQAALQESREETEEWRRRYTEVIEDAGRAAIIALHGEGNTNNNNNNGGGGGGDFIISSELVQREEALAAEESRLESKAKLLRATEIRLEELKKSMASQASVILQQHNSGGSNGSSDGRKRDGERSGKERRGATFLAAPRRYMQTLREQQGEEGFVLLRRVASYIFLLRLRTALPLFLLMVSFVLIFLATRRSPVPRERIK